MDVALINSNRLYTVLVLIRVALNAISAIALVIRVNKIVINNLSVVASKRATGAQALFNIMHAKVLPLSCSELLELRLAQSIEENSKFLADVKLIFDYL